MPPRRARPTGCPRSCPLQAAPRRGRCARRRGGGARTRAAENLTTAAADAPLPPPQRLADLERTEAGLLRSLADAVAGGGGGGAAADGATASLAALASALGDTSGALRAARSEALARAAALEERVQWDESELRRATADVKRLRAALKEEKRRNEKLFSTLDVEREANAQAQSVLSDMRARIADGSPRLSVGASFSLGRPDHFAAPARAEHAAAAPSPAPSRNESFAMHRSASLAGRASFAAMASPALARRPGTAAGDASPTLQ